MAEPKKKKAKRSYDAQVDSQVSGLRLVRQQRPPAPKAGESKAARSSDAAANVEPLTGEPELVSKLINFIKTI
jgi:hypothetical protein